MCEQDRSTGSPIKKVSVQPRQWLVVTAERQSVKITADHWSMVGDDLVFVKDGETIFHVRNWTSYRLIDDSDTSKEEALYQREEDRRKIREANEKKWAEIEARPWWRRLGYPGKDYGG